MRNYANRDQIVQAAQRLKPILDRLVFLGGAVLGLLITDEGAPDVRNTDDVDAIVKVAKLGEYYAIEERLRQLGFVQRSHEADPICRWVFDATIIDVMPTDERILGFGNRWYEPAREHASRITIHDDLEIHVITAPYFLATKIEAFYGRGNSDFLYSRDISDIVTLIDGRVELEAEIQMADKVIRSFLAQSFQDFMDDENFHDAVQGHLLPDAASQARASLVMDRIRHIIDMSQQ